MTADHLRKQFRFYRTHLLGIGIASAKNGTPLQHVAYMCGESIRFVDEDRVPKAMRWLGFIQGVLWMSHLFSIDQLKDHSRPTPEEEAHENHAQNALGSAS